MTDNAREIALRQVRDDDMPFLFRLFADPTRCHLWMRCRRVFDEAGFLQAWAAWCADTIAAKFVIEAAGQPVGLVFDYDRALEDGHTKVTTLLEDARTGHGSGVIATALFVGWLFQALPFRKVYMDVYGYNAGVVRILRKVGFAEESVLKENRFWDGAYWDLHVLSLTRAGWPAVRERLLRPRRRPLTPSALNGSADEESPSPWPTFGHPVSLDAGPVASV
jgi:RimJ/RimL family protein N-acetyltransferase